MNSAIEIHTNGKHLDTPSARISYMTLKAESEEQQIELARLYKLYTEGRLDELLAGPHQPAPIVKRLVHREGEKPHIGEFAGGKIQI